MVGVGRARGASVRCNPVSLPVDRPDGKKTTRFDRQGPPEEERVARALGMMTGWRKIGQNRIRVAEGSDANGNDDA